MAEAKKRGRPWGEIRPVNAYASSLAEFLRCRVDESGKTLAALSQEVGYSKSQTSTLLSGCVPPHVFVVRLIAATVPPVLRERRQAEALKLLRDAKHPPRAVTVPAQASAVSPTQSQVQADQIQVYERLTRALEQENELRQAAQNSAKLIWVLLGMVSTLDDRVRKLTLERDRLADGGAAGTLQDARQRIGRAEEQKAKAESELARAEEKRRQAEDLADRLRQEIEALTDELDRLRGPGPSPHDHLPVLAGTFAQGPAEGGHAEADDIDAALAKATAVNDEDADTIDRISTEITGGPAPSAEPVPIVPDNSPVSPDTANKPAHQLQEEAEEATSRGDAAEAARLFLALAGVSAAYLGANHEDTLFARHNHAHWVGEAGDPAGARDLYAALITDYTRAHGPDDEDTLDARQGHARWTGEAGDPAGARDLYAALVTDCTRVHGAEHEDTLRARYGHARWTSAAGNPAGARDLHASVVTDCTRALGPDHEGTLTARHGHARWTGEAGDPAGARDLYAALITDCTRVLGADHEGTLIARRG
ncbi:tetratricopeptide repeat protein, partial [Streptomyces hydrogenans]|uniref:tetratricopeptide repeat protein n=1 Tax=Streptomyces hydrogenans TaxID=1873719 RepID=UPI0035DA4F0E